MVAETIYVIVYEMKFSLRLLIMAVFTWAQPLAGVLLNSKVGIYGGFLYKLLGERWFYFVRNFFSQEKTIYTFVKIDFQSNNKNRALEFVLEKIPSKLSQIIYNIPIYRARYLLLFRKFGRELF